MENILTFAQQEFRTFEEVPFSTVDSIILSWLSYICWPESVMESADVQGIPIVSLFRAEDFPTMFLNIKEKELTFNLLTAVIANPRYRSMRLRDYVNHTNDEEEKQFSAVTFLLNETTAYVAFRGTDSTFIGWKEDFNMSFQYPIPSQKDAAEYLRQTAEKTNENFYIGGHSKGGNLAIYAAANNLQLFNRILKVYSHDGPGFLKEVIDSTNFKTIAPKVEKTVPQFSVFGMLLEQHEDYQVIRSEGKNFWQHDPFSWTVQDGQLCPLPEITKTARYFDKAINEWVTNLPTDQRERFVDTIYKLTDTLDVSTFLELNNNRSENFPIVLSQIAEYDPETRQFLMEILNHLAKSVFKSMADSFASYWINLQQELSKK